MFAPNWERNEDEKKISKALEVVAKEVGAKSISAGKRMITQIRPGCSHLHSGYRICDAESSIRLSHHWWSQG